MHFDIFRNFRRSSVGRRASKQKYVLALVTIPAAMRRIKEVEIVDSVDDLKTSQSIREHHFPNFEMLDAKIPSSLQKIIQNSNFKKRVNLAGQKAQLDDRFLRGRQIACMIYECFRVVGAHDGDSSSSAAVKSKVNANRKDQEVRDGFSIDLN